MRFKDQTVLIFGGSNGIGRAAARSFKAEGARVAVTGRDAHSLERVAAECGAMTLRADMGSVSESRDVVARASTALGPIDVLFVNAGVGGFAAAHEVSEEFWDSVHRVNLRGAFFATQAALPKLRDGGNIVFTGSIGAVLGLAGNMAYASAKAGLRAVARTFAIELLPRRIRVNMVSPGPIDTEIFKRDATPEQAAEFRAMLANAVPMKRIGEAEEVARAVLFLASSEASFINAVDLNVDGGCVEL